MDATSRRAALGGTTLAALALSRTPARADTGSTWDQIMQTKKLRVGAALSDPWYYRDTTGSTAPGAVRTGDVVWRGMGPTIAQGVAKAMNVTLEMVDTTWGTAVAGLQANQFDTMFILDPTPERALAVNFVPAPVLWYPIALLARSDLKGSTWTELNDPAIRAGVVLGSSTDQTATRLMPKSNLQRYQTTGEMLAAFQSNRIDAAFTTAPTADLTAARMKQGHTLILKPVVAVPAGAAVRQEADRRWSDYLTTVVTYFYNTGITQQFYDDFMSFRGLEPGKATPIQRELW